VTFKRHGDIKSFEIPCPVLHAKRLMIFNKLKATLQYTSVHNTVVVIQIYPQGLNWSIFTVKIRGRVKMLQVKINVYMLL